jgi:predicted DNA-binding transcriptional regulator AlpA
MSTDLGGRVIDSAEAAKLLGFRRTKTFRNTYKCMHPPQPGCQHPCGIPAVRRGRSVRFRERAVLAWIERHEVTP